EIRYEGINLVLRRLSIARRRHEMTSQFSDRFLPNLRIVRRSFNVQGIQREPAGFQSGVVTSHTVGCEQSFMLIQFTDRHRGLPNDLSSKDRRRNRQKK